MHADKIAYFFIAFAIYLLLKGVALASMAPIANTLLYLSIAISLLASNVPRVMDIPLEYAHPARMIEYFTFFVAICCFILLCLHHIWL